MIISVKHATDKEIQHELDKDVVIVGRSSSCDLAIKSDNISRQHLEIKLEGGKILIKDLSSKNWVSYDGEQLSKEEYVQYFDFIDLILPDEYQIVIKDPAAADRREDKTELKTISRTNIIKPKKPKQRKILSVEDDVPEKSKLEENKNIIIGAIIFFVAISALVYFKFM